jgi:hypothetical protein
VRRVLLRWVPLATLATLAVGLVLMLAPIDRELVLRIYALVVGGLAIATLSAATAFAARRTKSAFAAAMRDRPVRHGRPEELERLERQVALSVENAADFHFRLRPTLVAATDAAVWRRFGLQLDHAEPVLSPELWAIVDPERQPPPDRRAPGPPLAQIESAVDEIERIRA